MSVLSVSRKLSSTAFLIHWCVVHWPTPLRVATRNSPLFKPAITCSTALRIAAGAVLTDRLARSSHAASMMDSRAWVMLQFLVGSWGVDKVFDAKSRLHTLGGLRHQRHADTACAGVESLRGPCQEAAGQNGDIVKSEQLACEGCVITLETRRDASPQIKAGVGQRHVQHRL